MFIGVHIDQSSEIEKHGEYRLMRGTVQGIPDCYWVQCGNRVVSDDMAGSEYYARATLAYYVTEPI